jgi:ketosteroid isomerase-like protein
MGKALETVNRFYDLTNNKKKTEGLKELITEEVTFVGPLIRTSGASQYIQLNEQFLTFHKNTHILKQFENGDDVCSIYEMEANTPSGGTISLMIADWIRVSKGRISEQRIYYDPREFAKAFGM